MAAVIPSLKRLVDLVGLVDGINRVLVIPETRKENTVRRCENSLTVQLTGQLWCLVQLLQILPGIRYGWGQMAWMQLNRKEYRTGDWRSGDCPEQAC
jgi:hypothetical protein